MIPKYILDKSQTVLNTHDLSISAKLMCYRKMLYYDVYNKLKNLKLQKDLLIKSYLIAIKEIDKELKLQSLLKGHKK
jgi:hypothetical protein